MADNQTPTKDPPGFRFVDCCAICKHGEFTDYSTDVERCSKHVDTTIHSLMICNDYEPDVEEAAIDE